MDRRFQSTVRAAVGAPKIATRDKTRGGEIFIDTGQNASAPGIFELSVAAGNPPPRIVGAHVIHMIADNRLNPFQVAECRTNLTECMAVWEPV